MSAGAAAGSRRGSRAPHRHPELVSGSSEVLPPHVRLLDLRRPRDPRHPGSGFQREGATPRRRDVESPSSTSCLCAFVSSLKEVQGLPAGEVARAIRGASSSAVRPWMLKQVQHDGTGAASRAIPYFTPIRPTLSACI